MSIIKTVQMLESKYEIALDLLLLIGISVTGLSKADLIILFDQRTEEQEADLESLLQLMLQTSLFLYDEETENFKIQNFIIKFVDYKLQRKPEKKLIYN